MATLLVAQGGGHEHLDLGITVGPLFLRVALLAAVSVVAGFALLRGFLAEPGRFGTAAVVATAGGAALLELLLADGLSLPQQVVPLLLAAVAGSLYLALSRDERFAPAVARARRLAPLVFWPVAALAAAQFGVALFGDPDPERTVFLLHTGVLAGLVALAWFAVARPRGRAVVAGLRIGASLMATALLGGAAQAMVLRPADPEPGLAMSAEVSHTVEVLVVPDLSERNPSLDLLCKPEDAPGVILAGSWNRHGTDDRQENSRADAVHDQWSVRPLLPARAAGLGRPGSRS